MTGRFNITSCFNPPHLLLLSSEERESAGETVPVPEVGEQRAAGETSRSHGHDQGHQAQLWQQQTTEEHARRGPLQVRQAHRKCP